MSRASSPLPRWNMRVLYPGVDSDPFREGFRRVVEDITALEQLFDQHGVDARAARPLDESVVAVCETLIERFNTVVEATDTLIAYLYCFVSTDSRDTVAQAALSALEGHAVRLAQLDTRFAAWLGAIDIETLIERSPVVAEHAYALRIAKQRAAHLMALDQEALAAELDLTGGTAWAKLHANVSSQLMVRIRRPDGDEEVPISVARGLAFDPDRAVRRAAYEAELAGWESVAVPLAAAINSIKGETNTLTGRRGWPTPLEASLFSSRIDRPTLDAMMGAARDTFPVFRRYLHAKARALDVPRLAWYDLFAPVGDLQHAWSYDEAIHFIIRHFGEYSARMGEHAARAFGDRWVDAEPRPGKGDGAFCIRLRGAESRVLANFKPAYDAVFTLAHELGHAYHNLLTAACRPLQRQTPMTLAETASIFCETLVREAAVRAAGPAERLAILDASLLDATQVIVDITSRFLFEQRLLEARRERELSVDELCRLMLDAQRETYGDGLDPDVLHPFMWAVKGHYYSTSLSFYNYPYMFGLLFVLGLYARYREDPAGFKPRYDTLLASTGMADAATLAASFGIDIRTPDFWRSSLLVIQRDVEEFERLSEGAPSPECAVRGRS